ncbi:hypothetical protein MRX96_002352 [Rhipicephalus microplus]
MAKRSKRNEREEPMVQCDRCRRWVYLDETDFACTDAADVALFTCNLCNVVGSLETRLRASDQEVETLGRAVRAMKDQLEAYYAKPDPSGIPIAKPTLEEHQEDAMLSCSSQAPGETTREVKQPEVEEGSGQSPQKPQERRSAPKTTIVVGARMLGWTSTTPTAFSILRMEARNKPAKHTILKRLRKQG